MPGALSKCSGSGHKALLVAALAVATIRAGEPQRIQLVVVDRSTGRGIADAAAAFTGPGGVHELQSSEHGIVDLAPLPPGSYRLEIQAEGYIDPEDAHRTGHTVLIDASRRVMVVALSRQAVISGTVTDDQNRPISVMGVSALRTDSGPDVAGYVRRAATSFTDSRGEYRLHGLPPGDYIVAAMPAGDAASAQIPGVAYFGGPGREIARAERIRLEAGAEYSGANIRVAPAAFGGVRGVISGIPPGSTPRAAVAVMPPSPFGIPIAFTTTGPNGEFEFDRIPAGEYILAAWGPAVQFTTESAPTTQLARFGSLPLAVRESESSNVSLELKPGVAVQASLSDPACGAPSLLRVHADGWPGEWSFPGTVSGSRMVWESLPPGPLRFTAAGLDPSCSAASEATRSNGLPEWIVPVTSPASVNLPVRRVDGELTIRIDGIAAGESWIAVVVGKKRGAVAGLTTRTSPSLVFKGIPGGEYLVALLRFVGEAPGEWLPKPVTFFLDGNLQKSLSIDLNSVDP